MKSFSRFSPNRRFLALAALFALGTIAPRADGQAPEPETGRWWWRDLWLVRPGFGAAAPKPSALGEDLVVDSGNSPYAFSSGAVSYDNIFVGQSGAGVLNQSGGALSASATGQVFVGYNTGSSGIYNLSNGTLNTVSTDVGAAGTGVFTLSGDAVHYVTGTDNTPNGSLDLGYYSSGNGTYNLNRTGALYAGYVRGGSGTSTFNFNGGVLIAQTSTPNFIQNLTHAYVQENGALINTFGFNVTVAQALLHDPASGAPANDGGLTKQGAGTLTLTGVSTYTGATTVSGGTLAVANGASIIGNATRVAAGATLAISGTGSVTPGTGNLLSLDGSSASPASATLSDTGNLSTGLTFVGYSGAASFTQSGGSFTTNGNELDLGYSSGSNGAYMLSGTGSLSTGVTHVGYRGTGSFTQSGGAFTGSGLTLGDFGAGSYALSGTGSLSMAEVVIGVSGAGAFTQSGGAFTVTSSVIDIGYYAGSSGTYTLSGAGSLSTGRVIVGDRGTGAFTQSGGAFTTNGATLYLGYNPGGSGTYNLGGGTLTTGRTQVGDQTSTANFLQSGGTHTTGTLGLSGYSTGSQGAYTLAGGTLNVGSVVNRDAELATTGTSTFHFAGGVLQASGSSATFLQGLTTADVQAGGARIDTQGFNVTIAQNLLHDTAAGAPAADGGLTKSGSGALTLTGTNTYSGATTVSAGTLLVNGVNNGAGSVTVQNSGSVLGGAGTIAGAVNVIGNAALNPGNNVGAGGAASTVGALQVGALTLNSTATAIFDVNSATLYDQLNAAGNVTLGGSTLALNVNPNTSFSSGQVFNLIHLSGGTLSGTFANVANGGIYTFGGSPFQAEYTSTNFNLISTVPEPATWLAGALLCGAAGLTLRHRRREVSSRP